MIGPDVALRLARAQNVAWKIADQLGWADTLDAEYVALTQLQADAFITLDAQLAQAVQGLVTIAPIEALSRSRALDERPRVGVAPGGRSARDVLDLRWSAGCGGHGEADGRVRGRHRVDRVAGQRMQLEACLAELGVQLVRC